MDEEQRLKDLIGGIDIEAVDTIPPGGDGAALERIRRGALLKAGFGDVDVTEEPARARRAKKRRFRWPARALIAAAALLLTAVTAFAVTDLGYLLEDRFGDDFSFLTRMRLVTRYGQAVEAAAADQGVTARVEAAYSNESGALLLLSLADEQARLSEEISLRGGFARGGYGSYSSRTTLKRDTETGVVYALIEIVSSDPLSDRRTEYALDRITTSAQYHEHVPTDISLMDLVREASSVQRVDELGFTRVDGGGPLSLPIGALPGLTLTDVSISDEGLIVKGSYRSYDASVEHSSIMFSLIGPGGEALRSDYASYSWPSSGEEGAFLTAGFAGLNEASQLDGYALALSYQEEWGFIEGNWTLSFRMPQDQDVRRVAIRQEVTAGALTARIEEARITKNAVVVTGKRLSQRILSPEARSDFGILDRSDEIDIALFRGDQEIGRGGTGSISSGYYDDDIRAMVLYEGALDGADLCFIDAATREILLRVPLE